MSRMVSGMKQIGIWGTDPHRFVIANRNISSHKDG